MSSPSDAPDLLLQLFAGNTSVIGTEEGGCDRLEDPQLWPICVQQHFNGGPPVGVYPMVRQVLSLNGQGHLPGGWVVRWGCVDFDEGDADSLVHARNLVGVLEHFGITGWIEKSRSKGYHVWVFLGDWTPAPLVRRALLAGCQIANAPTREINPKQEQLAEGQVGNYVRLPYPARNPGADGGHRMVWSWTADGTGGIEARDNWARAAYARRVDATTLEPLAALWQPPVLNVSKTFGSSTPPPGMAAERRLSGLAYTMYRDGMGKSDDRSAWLWSFARELVKCDLTQSECREFLYAAHDSHAPKWQEPNRSKQLDRLLAKAAGA